MRRRRPLRAEIVLGLDQAAAEELLPVAVHRRPAASAGSRRRPASAPSRADSRLSLPDAHRLPAGARRPARRPCTSAPRSRKSPRLWTNVSRGSSRSLQDHRRRDLRLLLRASSIDLLQERKRLAGLFRLAESSPRSASCSSRRAPRTSCRNATCTGPGSRARCCGVTVASHSRCSASKLRPLLLDFVFQLL